jgi:hypothetical protein
VPERPIYAVPKPPIVMKDRRQAKLRTPVKKVREKTRPGRLKGADLTALRDLVWKRDRGICHECKKRCDRKNWHMAHRRNKRMWGDNEKNACVKHPHCHLVIEHTNGGAQKICPPKSKTEDAMELFGGIEITGANPQHEVLLKGRSDFIGAYCATRGWKEPLTVPQIMEIRAQDGWKNPGGTSNG